MDIYKELQMNPVFTAKIEELSNKMLDLEQEIGSSAPYTERFRELVYDVFRACDYNCGLLFPIFFPQALPPVLSGEGSRPLSLLNRPYAFCMTGISILGSTTIRGSRQIAKSSTYAARQLILSHIIPGWRSIHATPHSEHFKTYANRLREMERHFRYRKNYAGYRQNLAYKEYPNHSFTELVYIDESALAIRGKGADDLLLDEVQNLDPHFLPEIEQVLRSSQIKSQTFAGTSLSIDTLLEAKYQQGSMATWHVRSGKEGKWIDCGNEEEALQIIKPGGPTCPYTGNILDMSDGEFVHAYPERAHSGFTSFHIPQIIIPEFSNDLVQWDSIVRSLKEYEMIGQLKKFIQEILGIPTEEGLREITETDLKSICIIPETKETLLKYAQTGKFKYVVSGIDWGGSDWNPADRTKLSYTFHTIMGITTDNKFDILYMYKYAGMDYRTILACIAREHKRYGAGYVASDFAAGSLYNGLLREQDGITPSKHFILGYGGPDCRVFARPQHSELENHYTINRTETITALFMAIKDPRVKRLRCYGWNAAREHLMDFLNLFRIPADDGAGGKTRLRYRRHGSKADDGLHAVNLAFIICRLLMGEALIEDRALKAEIDQKMRRGNPSTSFSPSNYVISG